MALTSIFLKFMHLNFFHEKYQELNVVISDFRVSEKYRQYRDNHWKQGWWEDKKKKTTSVTTDIEKKKTEKYYLLKNFQASMEQTPRSQVLRLRYGVLPLTQFCYLLKMHVSKFDPCKWRLKSWKDSWPKVSFSCFCRCRRLSCCKISFQFSL